MAPVELVLRLAGREAQRNERPHRNPCSFAPPRFREPVHAVMGTVRQRLDRAILRTTAASIAVPAGVILLLSPEIAARTSTHSPSFGAGWTPRSYLNSRRRPRITLRTVARDTESVERYP